MMMKLKQQCALSSPIPTTQLRAVGLRPSLRSSRRKKRCAVETLPSSYPAATSTATSLVVFSQRTESDGEHSVGGIDPYRPITSDIAAYNSVAVDHARIRRTVDHHSIESYRLPAEIERQRANDLVCSFARAGDPEDSSFGSGGRSARFIQCQRVEKASLSTSVEREV